MVDEFEIAELRDIARKHGFDHVICFATKGKKQFVATYGRTVEECDQAAQFGDKLKDGLGWPESLHAMPSRVKKLTLSNEKLKAALKLILDKVDYSSGNCVLNQVIGAVLPKQAIDVAKQALKGNEKY